VSITIVQELVLITQMKNVDGRADDTPSTTSVDEFPSVVVVVMVVEVGSRGICEYDCVRLMVIVGRTR